MPKRKRPSKLEPPVKPRDGVALSTIVERLEDHDRSYDRALLARAHDFSAEKHGKQTRRSGEPYLVHPVYVAYILADLGFDGTCVAVGLLHDVLEDTLATRKELEATFGPEVVALVEGVTKIGRHAYVQRDQAQAETFRKLILASAQDIRVIVVKLADRLHNMMTLQHLGAESRDRIARETLEIYAPLAHRLGMSKVQGDLADLAFYNLHPQQYATLEDKLHEKVRLGREATDQIRERLVERIKDAGIEAEISFRVKGYYSIYNKLQKRGIDISELYDYLAFRVVTESVPACYAALGVVHQSWRPLPGRFKDYIAMPKPNLYRSLHTVLVGDSGQPFEVQIRTFEMDVIAEEGIAAHWRYKESGEERAADESDSNILWLRQLLEWQKEIQDPRTFLTTLKIDLYPDEVYAFSPRGEVFSFPRGATPLDFAYKIHTELGHRCVGARINGRLVPLKSELRNGDIVEVVTNANRQPSRDWLGFVVTSRAKSKIRHWLNTEQTLRALEVGRRLLDRALRRHKATLKKVLDGEALPVYLKSEGIASADDLLSRIGFGKISVKQVLRRVLSPEQLAAEPEAAGPIRRAVTRILPFGSTAIAVKGHDDLLAYLAKCCTPLPGDDIVGYVTRGKGVSVHAAECPNVRKLLYNPEREIEVEWAKQPNEIYAVLLRIETEDQPGILARLTEVIAKHESNIRELETRPADNGRSITEVVLEVRNRRELDRIRRRILGLSGVFQVDRRMAGSGLDQAAGSGQLG